MTHSFHTALTQAFQQHSDPERASSMEAYMKGHFEFYGIASADRKQLTRDVIRVTGVLSDERIEAEIRACWEDPYREVQYSAQELVSRKKWQKHVDSIHLFEWMIVTRSWWDTVDFIASNLVGGYFEHHPDQVDKVVRRWNASGNPWLIRSSILFQLKYKDLTDTDLLTILILPHLESKEFFIQKSIGWALRQVSKTNPGFVRSFIEKHSLSTVSMREAKKYI